MSTTAKHARILITGSRHFDPHNPRNYQLMHQALSTTAQKLYAAGAADITVVHGGASGADTLADIIASSLGFTIERYPAQWNLYGKQAGPIRNEEMVARGANIVLAFPAAVSPGTKHCMSVARRAGITVVNITNGDTIPDLTL